MSPLSKDETGHGSSILQRNSLISLLWLHWETAWLAALLLLLWHEDQKDLQGHVSLFRCVAEVSISCSHISALAELPS